MGSNLWLGLGDLSDPAHPYGSEIIEAVSLILYHLTGQRFPGVREAEEVYVCPDVVDEREALRSFYLRAGEVRPYIVAPNRTLYLHGTPVRKIIEVKEGDRVLDPSEYTLVNKSRLVRNTCDWSMCEGVSVRYKYGTAAPRAGVFAAISLADELIRYFNGDADCRIPQGAVSISRQGVDVQMIDMNDYIKDGRTGIPSVDLVIHALNPSRAKMRAKVFSPHRPRRERRD